MYIYYSLIGKKGLIGPKGIRGPHGKKGKDGLCTAKCGQSACYSLVMKKIQEFMDKENIGELKNTFIKNKINKICFSDKYIGFLSHGGEEKPNEKKLIDYIADTCLSWIKTILRFKNGPRFLNSESLEESFYDPNITPFKEIKKYEIWEWGEKYIFKPIARQQCSNTSDMPNAEEAELEILYTNHYEKPVFVNKLNPSRYGPDDCPYNQLGEDKTNPRNIVNCYYYNNRDVVVKKTWVKEEYLSFTQDISFYNVSKKTVDNKTFYPVGSVWRGNSNIYRNEKKDRYGPAKNTVLVSGKNIRPPEDFIKIWTTAEKGCEGCVPPDNSFSVWRPVPPKGYVSLGDYVSQGDSKPPLDTIRCIPEKCVQEIKIQNDSSVWDEKGFQKKSKASPSSKQAIQKFSKKISVWPVGITEKEEEILNYSFKKIDPLRMGGYNLFRANNTYSKPSKDSGRGWEIKPSCYTIIKTTTENLPNNDLGTGWLGGKKRENNLSVFTSLGYTPHAYITNTDKTHQNKGLGGYYLDHVKDDTYVMRTHNNKTNKYDRYVTYSPDNAIIYLDDHNKTSDMHLWKVRVIEKDKKTVVKIESSSGMCVFQKTDSSEELQNCDSGGTRWEFNPSSGFDA